MQGQWPLGYLGFVSIIDVLGRLLRVQFSSKAIAGMEPSAAVARVFDHMSAFLFVGTFVFAVFIAISLRRLTDPSKHNFLIIGDTEQGSRLAILNVIASAIVIGVGLSTAVSLYGDPDIGCMLH